MQCWNPQKLCIGVFYEICHLLLLRKELTEVSYNCLLITDQDIYDYRWKYFRNLRYDLHFRRELSEPALKEPKT